MSSRYIIKNALKIQLMIKMLNDVPINIKDLIIYMKKLLDSDWLRAVQFKCNTSAKSVTPVQKV